MSPKRNAGLFIAVFHFLSEFPFKEKHKDSNYYEKDEKVGTVGLCAPMVDGLIGKEYGNDKVGVFKKTIYFI